MGGGLRMIINTEQIEKLIKSRTAYGLAKELGIGRANLNNYKNGTYQMDQMTIGLATKLQNYYEKVENNMKTVFVEKVGNHVYYFERDDENKFFGSYAKKRDMFDHMIKKGGRTVVEVTREEATEEAKKAHEDGYKFIGMMYNENKNKIVI